MRHHDTNIALILAAGQGTRATTKTHAVPKQYRLWHGQPVLRHSLQRFLAHPDIHGVRVVINPQDKAFYQQAKDGLTSKKLLPVVAGGAERYLSALAGLRSLERRAPKLVVIHDGARPFCSPTLISRCLALADSDDGLVPALPATDSLHYTKGKRLSQTLIRQNLWNAQTPQVFRYKKLLAAYRAFTCRATHPPGDDADVAHRAGLAIRLVAGELGNRKLTFAQDFASQTPAITRVGLGFDMHRTGAGRAVILGGISIPAPFGIIAHSDGDVVLHALCDAIYGALGESDIGTHFPDNERRNAGRGSQDFLAHAIGRMHAQGLALASLDIVVLAQAPKLAPYRARLRRHLGQLLKKLGAPLPAQAIGFKATTLEGLGALGRTEGIGAQVIVGLCAQA